MFAKNNTTANELRENKSIIGKGVAVSHCGDKTVGQIIVENGKEYRFPIMGSETTKNKKIVYFDNQRKQR